MKMSEDDARHLYLVRAIEREDAEHILLTSEDREQADMAARSEAGTGKPEKYLAAGHALPQPASRPVIRRRRGRWGVCAGRGGYRWAYRLLRCYWAC